MWPHLATKQVKIAELKDRLSEHLRAVENGAEVVDRNRPIAQIVPLTPPGRRIRVIQPGRDFLAMPSFGRVVSVRPDESSLTQRPTSRGEAQLARSTSDTGRSTSCGAAPGSSVRSISNRTAVSPIASTG